MQITFKRTLLAAMTAAVIATPMASHATNGYFAHGYGTKNKGMAGAGVALPQDSLAAATNPAGMVHVGNRMDLGAAIFSPLRSYTEDGGAGGFVGTGSANSDSNYFLIPHFGRNWMLDGSSSFGVSVYGNGGMNTDWASPGPWPTTNQSGIDLVQLFVTPTYSKKIDDKSSWGASLILAYQRFKATGLSAFTNHTKDVVNPGDNGTDDSTGAGIRLGWMGEVQPGVTLGVSYTSRVYMSEFDKYNNLFAEGGDLDIPPQLTVGLAVETSPTSVVTADIQHIWFSDVDSVGNSIKNLLRCPSFGGAGSRQVDCFGGSNGPGFGWDDMTILKLGYQWESGSDMTYRVGVSHGKQPITETTLNLLAPAVMETHLTFGLTKKMGKGNEFSLAAMYAPSNSVNAPSAIGQPDDVEIEMDQFEVEASWAWKY